VRVGNSLFDEECVLSGVPQGSVLGPILFILFVNDIGNFIGKNSQVKLFADDLKSYSCVFNEQDLLIFARSLSAINAWAEAWQLPIAFQKCNYMQISNNKANIFPVFAIGTHVIHEISETKDLGVFFDSNLSFKTHISSVIANAKQRLFLIHKSFIASEPAALILAYKTYVLPILDYCSPVWSPHHVSEIKRLESVQRLFTRRLRGFQSLSYADRLTKASLCTLEYRRLRADLVLCYKMLHGLTCVSDITKFFVRDVETNTRGHNWRLRAERPRLESRLNFFAYRTVKVWNCLTYEAVNAESVSVFSKCLSRINLTMFLKIK
jgi:ribonuclease P/MRP protein subunit RPP40